MTRAADMVTFRLQQSRVHSGQTETGRPNGKPHARGSVRVACAPNRQSGNKLFACRSATSMPAGCWHPKQDETINKQLVRTTLESRRLPLEIAIPFQAGNLQYNLVTTVEAPDENPSCMDW